MAAIFIADDDPLLIDLLRFRLERRGHVVHSSTDGDEALQQILDEVPDLIILDYQMPVRNAHEIIEALKHDERCRDLPVFVLASQWREEDVMDAFDLGITDYITKPFSPDELVFRLERALK